MPCLRLVFLVQYSVLVGATVLGLSLPSAAPQSTVALAGRTGILHDY
ncbi:hypothetical protein BRADI_2g45056v3 [Brachypodium distachyon]|uniref:Uncharacterized protein n=1 Tax=Brachypodium distachyon TaxID=15368 RepID=A0A2K2DDW5_BRADI|nr:hypothetical protein BRADI_2g45056v3 [Brachypodium distachyon]